MTGPADSRIDYLARTAFRTYRDWTISARAPLAGASRSRTRTKKDRFPAMFDQLPPAVRQAWREAVIAVWNEIYADQRPPVTPTPRPRERRTGWADMLDEP